MAAMVKLVTTLLIIHVGLCVKCLLFLFNLTELKYDDDIYLTAIGLTPGGSITRHIYKQTVHEIHIE